ncbi:response regulator [Dokdonella soli]|uniref:response regulator n=1 Tax=Dokdonella soli TaxID=529810 RepID=UPI0031DF4AA7
MAIPHILVADDNPLTLRFFVEALHASGVHCVEASDGALALDRAKSAAFDLLLLDARMPNLDGTQALARIRALPGPSQHVVALATTADNDPSAHAALRNAGFAEVLVKPLGIDALRGALARHLPAAGADAKTDCAGDWIDDCQALAAAGGDGAIVSVLRGLFVRELETLPTELAAISERGDAGALRDRLHRLDASAGFCGVPALVREAAALRAALDAPTWPRGAIAGFLAACERVRAMLAP